MEKISTKDRILDAALTLFAQRGYDGIGVDLIASAVGMKGPSLYKHFKGKEEILQALMDRVSEYYERNFGSEQKPGRIPGSVQELVQSSMVRIRFTMNDPVIRKVRRLLAMEQFRNPRIAQMTTLHTMDGIWNMYRMIFEEMIRAGSIRPGDPYFMAMEFASPVTLLIQLCDREPAREDEVLRRIGEHMQYFADQYRPVG